MTAPGLPFPSNQLSVSQEPDARFGVRIVAYSTLAPRLPPLLL
jgi:hypothetical protein